MPRPPIRSRPARPSRAIPLVIGGLAVSALIATGLVAGCVDGERAPVTDATAVQPQAADGVATAAVAPSPAPAPAPAPIAAKPEPPPSIGGGTVAAPAEGPAPGHGLGGDGFVLVKNWDFGTGAGSTVHDYAELSANFQYHDQFGTIANGTNYGALIVAPDAATSLKGRKQPIEGPDTGGKPVREFLPGSMRTYLVPLHGATSCLPDRHDVGCGSFQAIWKLPKGGSRLGQDVLWETRVRYHTPPYYWFAIWTCGNKWNRGAEIDVVEGFGYDNGGGYTNYDGRFWHVGIVGGREDEKYGNWGQSMKKFGITSFDVDAWHTWTLLYKADNSIVVYMDGIQVQTGFSHWTLGTKPDGEELDMSFLFDGGWGHTGVKSVDHELPASAFDGCYYEWDYSRVYLRPAGAAK